MKRNFLEQLLEWKKSPHRKPLIVDGARQVGKTYTIQEFGQAHYGEIVTANFEQDPSLAELFDGALNPSRIVEVLRALSGKSIEPETTLIFFDEIQQCERALTSLKYFCEQASDFHVVAAGSLLGLRLGTAASFPVGKVDFLSVYPMTFLEFLSARGEDGLRSFVESDDADVAYPAPLRSKLEENLRYYYYVGGMPESVATFCEKGDFIATRKVQNAILKSYLFDFSKYAAPQETVKISAIWESVPIHLSKENKKFTFSAVKQSARAREYESSLQWLIDAGLLIRVGCTENPLSPLQSTVSEGIFKIFLFDVGLLAAMVNLDSKSILSGDALFTSFRGALAENYVAQTLIASGWNKLYYWTSGNQAEIDFIIEQGNTIVPIEVKSGFNTRSKSLSMYSKKYNPALLVRTSLKTQSLNGNVYDCPLYILEKLRQKLALMLS